MKSVMEFRDETSPDTRNWRGILRRVAISLTSGATWQTIGHVLMDGVTKEARPAEVFSGVGFYSRPAPGANAEAIVGFVGGASNPHVIATRDEDTRKKVAQLDQDETAIYNTSTIAVARKSGTFEVRAAASPTVEPALLGHTYRSAEDTMISSLQNALDALKTYAIAVQAVADPSNTATPPLTTALLSFHSAVTSFQSASASYLTSVLRVQ